MVQTAAVNAQEIVSAIAPWVAVLGSIVALSTAIVRLRQSTRLRSNLAGDAEIYAKLPPESVARTALRAALDHQSELLRRRVVDGVQPNVLQLMILIGLLLLAISGLLRLLILAAASTERPLADGAELMAQVAVAIGIVFGALMVCMGGVGLVIGWLDVQTERALADENDESLRKFVRAFKPRSTRRRHRGDTLPPTSRTRRTDPSQSPTPAWLHPCHQVERPLPGPSTTPTDTEDPIALRNRPRTRLQSDRP